MTIFQPSNRTKIVGVVAVLLTVAWMLQSAHDAGGGLQRTPAAEQAQSGDEQEQSANQFDNDGVWKVFETETKGVGVCSVGAGYGDHQVLVSMIDGNRETLFVSLQKKSWEMPLQKPIDIYVTFDAQAPLVLAAKAGRNGAIFADATGQQGVKLIAGLYTRKLMKIRFGDILEPVWNLSLKGSSLALEANFLCMSRWQRMSK